MLQGISTSRRCDTSAACLAAAGMDFVIRYYSRTTKLAEKRLTPAEATALAQAGIDIAAVYQDRARQPADFGLERGQQDGASAFTYAGQMGQPLGSSIFFAVDADFSKTELQNLVFPYFKGIKQAFDSAAPSGSAYRIGVYGSGLCCRLLKEAFDFVELTWLAEATGWRESASYQGWNVKQTVNTRQQRCSLGTAWEHCEAQADFDWQRCPAQWPRPCIWVKTNCLHAATRSMAAPGHPVKPAGPPAAAT